MKKTSLEIKKNELPHFGEAYTLLGIGLIVLDEQLTIKYINDFSRKLLVPPNHPDVCGSAFIPFCRKMNLPPLMTSQGAWSYKDSICIGNQFRKWHKKIVFIDNKKHYFLCDMDSSELENIKYTIKSECKKITGHPFDDKISTVEYIHEIYHYLTNIINKIPCYIYWKNTRLEYIGCNQMAAEFVNFKSPEEIIGKSDLDIFIDKELARSYQIIDQKILATGAPVINEPGQLINHQHQVLQVLVSKVPITDIAGHIIGLVGITVDVTELTLAKEAAESAVRAKTAFMANMSHDIRTPLTGVIGMSESLENTLQNPTEKESAHMLHDSGQELLSMLNDILDDIRADNVSEVDLTEKAFDLYRCIQDLVKLELPTTKLKGLGLEVSIEESVPRYIVSDRKKIHRILLNLLGNAIKFTKSGKVTIEVKCLDRKKSKVHLEFGVADTGIGIPKEMQAKVFDRFFRVTPSYKGLYAGHGLGLHIAQSYVSLLGGHITLTSEEGVGTTFHFDLQCKVADDNAVKTDPINQALEKSPAPSPNRPPTPHTPALPIEIAENAPHILLVEDNPIALKVLETIVTSAGSHPTTAADGEQALALVKSGDFDLIVTDIGLPGISGNELASCIREWEKENSLKNIPIIGLTGHARDAAMAECLESGMNDVFTKPASLPMIKEIVNKFISSQEPASHTLSNAKATSAPFGKLGVDLPDTEDALFELESFPVFDPKYGLQQINDLALLFDIWKAYISDEVQNDIHLMKKAYAKKDWAEVERLAHKIKGGVCYGTRRIFYACQYLERYYKAGHRMLLDKLYHQVLDVNGETIVTLTEWLGKYSNK